jgi:hypothetical protein
MDGPKNVRTKTKNMTSHFDPQIIINYMIGYTKYKLQNVTVTKNPERRAMIMFCRSE